MNSIYFKINVAIITVTILVTAFFSFMILSVKKTDMNNKLAKEANYTIKKLSINLPIAVSENQPNIVDKTIYYEIQNENITAIIVTNDNDELISGYYKNDWNQIINFTDDTRYTNNNAVEFKDILIYGGKNIGSVKVLITFDNVRNYIKQSILRFTLFSFTLTLFILFAIQFIIYSNFTYPLILINRTIGEYSDGKFDKRIKIKGDNELSALAVNINQMANNISEKNKLAKN